jgi:hypothetical protein
MNPQHPFPVKFLILPADGRPPATSTVSQRENTFRHSPISRTRRLVEIAMSHRAPRLPDYEVLSESECERGWKRWLLSHHLFIPTLALTGYCLERTAEAIAAGHVEDEAFSWLEIAAKLRRGCGALFLYGVDFEPCSAIYCGYIRSRMPRAFSGYQILERQNAFLPGLTAFRESLCRFGGHTACTRLHNLWVESDIRYHEGHQRCMLRSVSPSANQQVVTDEAASGIPESLRAAYRRHHGNVPPIDENAFRELDVWFGIERRDSVTWIGYAAQVAAVMQDIIADLEAGHRLEPEVTAELFDSMNTTLALLDYCIGNSSQPHQQHTGEYLLV